MPLPPLPKPELSEIADISPEGQRGFLKLKRHKLRVRLSDGTPSETFVYDSIDRDALDAVVIAAHYRDPDGVRRVYLRSALRPPVALRPLDKRPFAEKDTLGALWELPAGLVEPGECTTDGLARCAARELNEELGFDVPSAQLRPLGHATFPAPGMIGERHHYFHVEVVPSQRGAPTEDGSVLERNALVAAVRLREAIELIAKGEIEDGKSEIALRRLMEV